MLLEPRSRLNDRQLTLGALRVAATCRLHCSFRRRPTALRGNGVVSLAMEQTLRELVQGHAPATAALDGRRAISRDD